MRTTLTIDDDIAAERVALGVGMLAGSLFFSISPDAADHKILLYLEDEKQKIDVRDQMDGIVAHFVHSRDAAHMMLTVNRLHGLGLRHFAMVHDSYGVHASDVGKVIGRQGSTAKPSARF